MQIIVDLENMLFLRKHEDYATLSKLCDMECSHVSTSLMYCDHARDFVSFTDLELKTLIKNAHGPDVVNVFSRAALCDILVAMIKQMPVSEVNAYEVDLQWRTIIKGDKKRYQYVPGGFVPVCAEGLAELAGWKYKAGGAASPLPRPASPVTTLPQGAVATPGASTAPRAVQAVAVDGFSMPKAGTSTHTVFMFCAERWKEAGCVDEDDILDKIKKSAIEVLVPQGLNISTVRTQAARWYQHRTQVAV